MKDEELLEWYKNNSSKPADMSDKDYELNKNKALKLQRDKALQENLQSQQSAINQAQTNAQQSASISNEKLMKYLGQAQLASGIAKGQTGSDFIKANNSYVEQRSAIANNTAAQQNELLNNYAADKLANEEQALNSEISILDKYRNREIEDENRQMAKEDRDREIQQWQVEMDAYKQDLKNKMEDRETSKAEKEQAKQENEDIYWLEAANDRINTMYTELMDENGNLSDNSKLKIQAAMEEYKEKFNFDSYYDKLLDLYKTMVYGK